YGIRVAVERGQLSVSDGVNTDRRWATFSRATCGLRQLVILGHTGSITLEAVHWLHDIDASIVQIYADGQVLLSSGVRGYDNAHLRRAQAMAAGTDLGLRISHDLIRAKINGQAKVLRSLGRNELAERLDVFAETVGATQTIVDLRALE